MALRTALGGAHGGLRRGELLGLCWSDLDVMSGTVRIRLQHVDGRPQLVEPKTALSARTVSCLVELLGHSMIAVTMNTYTHVMPHLQREAAGAVERALFDRDDEGARP